MSSKLTKSVDARKPELFDLATAHEFTLRCSGRPRRELDGKRQDILIEAVPNARRIAGMADSRQTPPFHLQALEHAARSRGVELLVFRVNGPEEIAAARRRRHRAPAVWLQTSATDE